MTEKQFYSWEEFDKDIDEVILSLIQANPPLQGVYGVPKGGLIVAVAIANRLNLPLFTDYNKIKTNFRVLVVDDISDSGKTLSKLPYISKHPTYAIFNRLKTKYPTNFISRYAKGEHWVVFPWEGGKTCKRDGTKVW